MTRFRDGDGPQGGAPEGEEQRGDGWGEVLDDAGALDALVAEDDGSALLPLLDAEAGPARPLAERELLVLVDRIERQFAQRQRPVSRFTPRRLLLAAGLFAASAAAAVVGVKVVQRSAEPAAATSPAEPRAGADAPPALPSAAEPSGLEPPAMPVPPTPALPAKERPAEADVVLRPGSVPTASTANSPSAKPAPLVSRSGATPRSSQHQGGTVAADRLAAANSLRSRHRYREALAVYLQLIEMDPNGMQASVARVAAAEMQLEQFHDVAGAERLYREARTQGGELTAEAQFGLSQVARARADAPGERRALQDFLSRHPESPLAAAARRRLNTVGDK
jgi:tetratricopeptide (TPR) repeat protein